MRDEDPAEHKDEDDGEDDQGDEEGAKGAQLTLDGDDAVAEGDGDGVGGLGGLCGRGDLRRQMVELAVENGNVGGGGGVDACEVGA